MIVINSHKRWKIIIFTNSKLLMKKCKDWLPKIIKIEIKDHQKIIWTRSIRVVTKGCKHKIFIPMLKGQGLMSIFIKRKIKIVQIVVFNISRLLLKWITGWHKNHSEGQTHQVFRNKLKISEDKLFISAHHCLIVKNTFKRNKNKPKIT